MPPEAALAVAGALRPASEAELAEAIRNARDPLSILGGGTRLRPGEGLDQPLRTTALTGIALYEPAALTLVARAGTPLAEIEALLAAEGQMLAFEPPPVPGSTIGGVIAANASGPRRVQAGAARDALIGVRFVDGTGAVIANGGRVMKNVTGYDLVKLMAGSRGTLGVLTEVALKTAPLPPATRLLRLPGLSAAEAIAPLTVALTGPFDVTAALWLPEQGALIRLEGLPQSVIARAEALKARLRGFEIEEVAPLHLDANILGAVERPENGPVDRFQRDRGRQSRAGADSPRSNGEVWRILCRPSQAATILAAIPEPLRLDWGGALIHARLAGAPLLPPGAVATRLTATPARLPAPGPVTARLEAGLRARFDPRGLFAGS